MERELRDTLLFCDCIIIIIIIILIQMLAANRQKKKKKKDSALWFANGERNFRHEYTFPELLASFVDVMADQVVPRFKIDSPYILYI